MFKSTNQIVSNRQKKKRLFVRTLVMTLFMVLFTQMVQAQIGSGDNYLVYMKEGNSMVASNANGVYFYDDHGPSHASNGNINYWDRWYSVNQHYTYVFRPKKEGDKIFVGYIFMLSSNSRSLMLTSGATRITTTAIT